MKLYWQADYAGRKPELLAFFTKNEKTFFNVAKAATPVCYTIDIRQRKEGTAHDIA